MSYTNLLYHIVYATKERAPLITKVLRPRLHEYLGGTVRGLGGIALEIHGMPEHVQLLVKLKPTISVSESLSKLKSNSSPWAGRQTAGRFGWQARYGALLLANLRLSACVDTFATRKNIIVRHRSRKNSRLCYTHIVLSLMKPVCGDRPLSPASQA